MTVLTLPRLVRAVISETLRLFPPVPQNQRECRNKPTVFPKSDCTYPSNSSQPIYVPPKTPVLFTTILTHRNKSLWGADADVFDPDRWLDERKSLFTKNPLMYTPFSAGPRIVSILSSVFLFGLVDYLVLTIFVRYSASDKTMR